MRSVFSDLAEREYSIARLLDHIEDVGETRGQVDVIVVLKSSFFIALYNNMEATVYSLLESLHSAASSFAYDSLNIAMQKKMLRYSLGKNGAAFLCDKIRVSAEISKIRNAGLTFPELSDYIRRQSVFSGNVDVRKLNVIGVSYGMEKVSFQKGDAEKVLWVKNKRNKIAHGEQSMSEGGQGIKTTDLTLASESVGKVLRDFAGAVGAHIDTGGFAKARNNSLETLV